MINMETFLQVLTFLTVMPICMGASTNCQARMEAGFIGLCLQPAWVFITFTDQQWGMFIASIVATYGWWMMFRNNRKQWHQERASFT